MTSHAKLPMVRSIGEIVRNAVVFKFRAGMNSMNDLIPTVSKLFAILKERNIDYVLVGGIAMLQYVEGRNTEDIDLIVAVSSLKKLPEVVIENETEFFAQGKLSDLKIDFLLTRNRLFELVRRSYTTSKHFVEQDIPCATVEGLLLLKLYALPSLYRQGNFARVNLYESDIAALVQAYRPNLSILFEELANHLNTPDLKEVRGIAREIQDRIDRFNRSASK
jgi:hypothetical protein